MKKPIQDFDFEGCPVLPIIDWLAAVVCGAYNQYDGNAYLAEYNEEGVLSVYDHWDWEDPDWELPKWATHVVWVGA